MSYNTNIFTKTLFAINRYLVYITSYKYIFNKHDISIFIYYNINIIVNRHFSHVKYIIFLNINYLLTNINILNE